MTQPKKHSVSPAVLKKNQSLIMGQFDRETDLMIEYVEDHLQKTFWGPLGIVLRKVAQELIQWFMRHGGKERGRKVFHGVIVQAAKVGEKSLDEVADEGYEDYKKHNELAHRVNRDHPAYAKFDRALRHEHRATLDLYARMMQSSGKDYPDLVRNAFPRRSDLERAIDARFRSTENLLGIIEKEDGLLKIPSMIRRPAFHIMRTAFHAVEKRIVGSLDDIYEP